MPHRVYSPTPLFTWLCTQFFCLAYLQRLEALFSVSFAFYSVFLLLLLFLLFLLFILFILFILFYRFNGFFPERHCPGGGLNSRPIGFQPITLPTELPEPQAAVETNLPPLRPVDPPPHPSHCVSSPAKNLFRDFGRIRTDDQGVNSSLLYL